MTVEDALPWLREHREGLLDQIRRGKYKPQPVRRKEIPKPDGGVRKLGIPTVVDRIIQQAIAQQLTPIFEPLFSDGSYGYRPGRSAQQATEKVKEYAEQGYTTAVLIDLSKYFDTLNHDLFMNMVREEVHDKRVISCHWLRHSFATRCVEAGINPKALQAILGHRDLATTMDLYAEATEELKQAEIISLDAYLNKQRRLSSKQFG